jgi:putative flippase GtrA
MVFNTVLNFCRKSSLQRFLLVGSVNTVIVYFIFYIVFFLITKIDFFSDAINRAVSYSVGHIVGIFTGFYLHGRYTYDADVSKNSLYKFGIFCFCQCVLLLAGSALVYFISKETRLNPSVVWFVVTCGVTMSNFILTKYLVF